MHLNYIKIYCMKFSTFNIKPQLIEILAKLGYVNPTKVQEVVIPKALKNENIIVKSETGSGKTHAFLIPLLSNVKFNKKLQAIILTPTRELGRQTYAFIDQVRKYEYYKNLQVKLFVSGEDTVKDLKSFNNGSEIIIATPGKLNYLIENSSLSLEDVTTVILDEADMLFDSGFFEDIDKIIKKIPQKPQIEVYSATISNKVRDFLRKYISPDFILTVNEEHNTSSTVNHHFINTKHNDRYQLILDFIKIKNPYFLLVFASSKDEVTKIYNFLSSNNLNSGIISGALEARERKNMLRRIKNNEFQVVVCSDLAARGLDIENVTDVLNFDLPNNIEYYYHRAGRSGRNYKNGDCYSFFDNDTTNIPLKLIRDGLKVDYLKFKDGELIEDSPIIKEKITKKRHTNNDLEKEIKKAKSKAMGKTVKPGYKKKVKTAIDKVKRKHKREIIKKDIRRQREERYRQESNKN